MTRTIIAVALAAAALSGCEHINQAIADAAARSNPTTPDFAKYQVVETGTDALKRPYTAIRWHNERGEPVVVDVYAHACLMGQNSAYTIMDGRAGASRTGYAIFLCSLPGSLRHELGHVAGMKHGPWKQNYIGQMPPYPHGLEFSMPPPPMPNCAKITASEWAPAGEKPRYVAGDSVCVAPFAAHYGDYTSN